MMFKYSSEVCCSGYFNKMACLLDVDTIETLDDAKVVQWIGHVHLELCLDVERGFMVFSNDNEIVDLAKNKDEFIGDLVSFVIETVLVGTGFEVQAVEHDAVDMFVP